ncbi:hydantoinase B/oxoprolinase family protein [Enterovirga rhinocerotis]|uniref:N-methylhydantoinase B n=1 Tax=Enterovirga rhinocerotis TaxID=1339210 RepID=A0A4R7BVE2_9HYPH|nr:hydantoinase B/oxoprolinase family protein [Enterovirga rhinocerotis]TDR89818.1 N-methylhydantoinase B [Enterovirga rhinocerotis]
MTSRDLDPITVEVVRNKLEGIANEMQQTLLRSSFSPIVKEGLDASSSLFTIRGETLAQAIAIPIHLATLIPVIEKMLEVFPLAGMKPGDVYCLNDPYLGGTHLPDIALVQPIFSNGRPIAISATMTHHQDMGGMAPGSIPTNATEVFQEGLRIPPLKFRDEGRYNETLVAMIRQNVRIPDIVMGDLNAQLAACNVGARRIAELAEEIGDDQLLAIFDDLLDRSEALTRAALQKIPDGTYRYVDFSDNDGIDLDKAIRFEVAVTIKDSTFHCDFTGTSPQVRGPFNCVPSGSLAAACYALRAVTDPNIPTNAGCFRPITLSLPEGSVVNPREPAAVNSRTATIKRITGCILGALKDVLPERVPADNAGEMLALMFGGRHADGKAFVTGELIAGGSGAGPDSDGVDVIETDVTNCMNLPVEAMEMDAPIRVHRIALREDSGGAGRQRGGLGIVKEYEILEGEVRFTYRGERHFHAPQGTQGGGEGEKAAAVIKRAAGGEEVIPSKQMATLWRGDRVVIETAGGAGYGPPATRDPEALALDIEDGKVSAGVAAGRYGPV